MRHHRRGPILARPSLLLATICYIAVATLGPLQHGRIELASIPAAAPVSQAGDAPDAPQPPTKWPKHDPRTCLFCHSFESVAVPVTGNWTPTATIRSAPDIPEVPDAAPEGARPIAQARAPPHSV